MARTQMPELTAERLQARISVWMLSASQGNPQSVDRIETTVDNLRMVGFTADVVREVIYNAAYNAALDPDDAVARFIKPEKETVKRTRKQKAN